MHMNNQNKSGRVIAGILLVVVVAFLGYLFFKKPVVTPVGGGVTDIPSMSGDTADLVQVSLVPGATLSGTVTIAGSLKGGYFFEANARGMLLDASKTVLKTFPLTATSSWMTTDAVSFTGTVDVGGAPAGPGFVRIANDNPSGDPIHDTYIDIPVVFQ